MSGFGSALRWFRRLSARRQIEAEMKEEMQLHLEHRIAEKIDAGTDPVEAKYESQREFGNLLNFREESRNAIGWNWLSQLSRDIRFAGRLLKRKPSFALTAVTSLALCLGINAAVFSVLYALVVRPLPFERSERIVEIYNSFPKVGIPKFSSNVGQYFDFKTNTSAFQMMALWRLEHDAYDDRDKAVRITTASTTEEFFPLLGVYPLKGHFFDASNHLPGADKVVVLTESFWRTELGAEPNVIGRKIRLNDESYEVIGIAPRVSETFDAQIKIIRPFSWNPAESLSRSGYSVTLIARLADGTTIEHALSEIRSREKAFYETAPARARDFTDRTGQTVEIDTLQSQRSSSLKLSLIIMQAAAAAVLLIGAVNVLNLQLIRAHARRSEFILRAALGASSNAIIRQLTAEAALIGCLGIVGGLVFARCALSTANHFAVVLLPSSPPFGVGPPILKFIIGTGLLLIAALATLPSIPVLQSTSSEASLQTSERSSALGRRSRWTADALVCSQVAFALVLLFTTGLLVHSFFNVVSTPPGFVPDQLYTARFDLPASKEKNLPDKIAAALNATVGFSASVSTSTPFLLIPPEKFSMPLGAFSIKDTPLPSGDALPSVFYCGVDAAYAQVIELPILHGRWFTEIDLKADRAVVIDENFRRRYFANIDPIGQRIAVNKSAQKNTDDWQEIIGVAGNVRHNGPEDKTGLPFVYIPRDYVPFYGSGSLLIRTGRAPSDAFTVVRKIMTALDPTIPVYAQETMHDLIADSAQERKGIMLLLSISAAVALFLAAIGVYGVLAYNVARRTREIGIRTALGSTRSEIIGMVVRDSFLRTLLGIGIGTIIAGLANRTVSALLFEVGPADLSAYIASVLVIIGTTSLAAWLPARKAAQVDPIIALRSD